MREKDRMTTLMKSKGGAIKEVVSGGTGEAGSRFVVDAEQLEEFLDEWPAAPKKIARWAIDAYGLPNEATPARLIWHNNGRWKRTMIQRDEIVHSFPTMHTDYITQWIDYAVPLNMMNDITEFDGSCLVDRTAGEVAARCDMESMNILTLNLMHEIVMGIRTVQEARSMYAEQAAAYVMDRAAPYTEDFLFEVPQEAQGDPDEAIIAPAMMRQGAGKMRDIVTGQRRGPDIV